VSDTTANPAGAPVRTTVADVIRDVEPMGDLSGFAIEDLTEAEEAEFFRIIEGA
jgi:hypothetical protein